MKRFGKIASAVLSVLLVLASRTLPAQTTTGQISGTVTDQGGAVVPGATVQAVAVDTQVSRTVQTGPSGDYLLTLLPPGNYKVVITKSGFQPLTENGIKLDVNQSISINPTLAVGTNSVDVQVEGSSQLMDASSSEVGTVIGERPVHDLPLNGRNFTQLLTLVPGATPISTSQGANQGTDDGSTVAIPNTAFSNPSINGQQNRESLYLLDGVVNTDFRTTTYTVLPIVDGVSEFKVQSHNDDPSFGFVLGGVINLISKSGSNQFHGSAWEFVRNNIFDSRNPFNDINSDQSARAVGAFHQNEFGAVIGGPVWIPKLYNGRDKTFFFFGFEGWRYNRASNSKYVVPTTDELNGIFTNAGYGAHSNIFDPTTTNSAGTSRQQFSNNVIPSNRINTQMQTYLKTYFDQPNLTGDANYNAILRVPYVDNSNNYQGRIDQTLTKHDTIFFRWSNQFVVNDAPATNTVTDVSDFGGLNIGAGITHVFNPHLILNVNGGRASRAFTFSYPSSTSLAELTTLGFEGLDTYGPVGVNLASPYGDSGLASAALRRNSAWSVGSQLSWLKGKHTFTFGASVIDQYRSQHGSGQSFTFDNSQTSDPSNTSVTGNSVASALLAYPSAASFQSSNTIKYSIPTYAVFGGDSWKVSPKLTLNLGLRFDHINQPNLTSGMNNGFNFDTGNWEIGGGSLPESCNVAGKAPCIPGTSDDAATDLAAIVGYDGSVAGSHIIVSSSATRAPKSFFKNYGPRVGFAYSFTPETVLRGGIGLVYDTLNGLSQTFSNSIGEWPAKNSSNPTYNTVSDTAGGSVSTVSDAESSVSSPLPDSSPFTHFDYYYSPNNKPLYSEQYNLQLEQTLSKSVLLTLGYVGSVSKHLDYGGYANGATTPGGTTTAEINSRRPYQYMTTFVYDSTIANGNYNSLQTKLEQRFTNGLQFLVSYTWSKSLDEGTSGHYGSENGDGPAIQDYYDPHSNYGVSGYDVTHFVSISSVYELPAGKGKRFLSKGPLSYALGGWQLNTVTQLRSGQPFTVYVEGDVANVGLGTNSYERPNQVASPYVSHPTKSAAFNTAAFTTPQNSYGDVARNSMRSQSYKNVDLSLFKSFVISEGRSIDLRAEGFNVFNIINYGVPGYDLSNSSSFGVITGISGNPRELQFAAKINF